MDMLKTQDKLQHDFIKNVADNWDLNKKVSTGGDGKPSVILTALVEHMHNLEEKSIVTETVYHIYTKRMMEIRRDDLDSINSDILQHKLKGHLPYFH